MNCRAMLVRGEGALASFLARRLGGGQAPPDEISPSDCLAVVVARFSQLRDTVRLLRSESSDVVLLVSAWRSLIYVGPIWHRGTTGCPLCLFSRVTASPLGADVNGQEPLLPCREATDSGLPPAAQHIVATLITDRMEPQRDPRQVMIYNTATGKITMHMLVPDSGCPVCGPTPPSTLPVFVGTGQPLHKSVPETLRLRPANADVLASYVSPTGLFHNLRVDLQSPFGASAIDLPPVIGRSPEPAMGRGRSYTESRAIAILEGLERYCGLHRGGGRRAVRAAYRDIADRAVYPLSFGVHPRESYDSDGFPFCRFSPDVVVDWVEAYSFARQAAVLVPERVAFWGPRADGEVAFFYDTSNGCALGGCAEEAILHGLLEVVERDSFLLTWYKQLRLPEIELRCDPDLELRSVLRKCELYGDCTFRAFLSTMEHGIPSVWLVAVGHDPNGPAVIAGAAAHPDPRRAVINGLYELARRVLAIQQQYPQRRAEALPMLHDPTLVRRLEHHPMINCLPESRDRFSFLLDYHTDVVSLAALSANSSAVSNDLGVDLSTAAHKILNTGLDLLVVDQTMPELVSHGLVCVRVMVPGLLPITFGHVNRRTECLPRLTGANVNLPYTSGLAENERAGRIPHPLD